MSVKAPEVQPMENRKTDIFGHPISKNARGRDGQEAERGPLDLTDDEQAVWEAHGFSVKRLIAALLSSKTVVNDDRG